jgi:hypothetical protein
VLRRREPQGFAEGGDGEGGRGGERGTEAPLKYLKGLRKLRRYLNGASTKVPEGVFAEDFEGISSGLDEFFEAPSRNLQSLQAS